jgi:hypothetical protein
VVVCASAPCCHSTSLLTTTSVSLFGSPWSDSGDGSSCVSTTVLTPAGRLLVCNPGVHVLVVLCCAVTTTSSSTPAGRCRGRNLGINYCAYFSAAITVSEFTPLSLCLWPCFNLNCTSGLSPSSCWLWYKHMCLKMFGWLGTGYVIC